MATSTTRQRVKHDKRMLAGKVAIVTGSTSGIGLGIARAFAAEGANVVLNGFGDSKEIEATRVAIGKDYDVTALYDSADMRDPAAIAAMIENTVKHFGSIDVLVNNAGIQHTAPVEEFPLDKWDAIIAINLSSAFHTIRAALPHMRKTGWGRIINVASVHGLVASAQKAAYVAAKHGIVGLTKVVALETAESRITCNAICPGWVRTPLVEKQIEALAQRENLSIEKAAVRLLEEKQPSKRFVEVEQIGALAVFLTSPAASEMTGQALPIDGGWIAR